MTVKRSRTLLLALGMLLLSPTLVRGQAWLLNNVRPVKDVAQWCWDRKWTCRQWGHTGVVILTTTAIEKLIPGLEPEVARYIPLTYYVVKEIHNLASDPFDPLDVTWDLGTAVLGWWLAPKVNRLIFGERKKTARDPDTRSAPEQRPQ